MPVKICAMAAMDEGRVIGLNGKLPWHYPEDLKYVMEHTTGHTVLMGRKTYRSLPKAFRPLPGRRNLVVTRNPEVLAGEQGIELISDAEQFLEEVKSGEIKLDSEYLWVFGGSEIYALTLPYWDELYLTMVKGRHEGDTFFPPFEQWFELYWEEERPEFSFQRYRRVSPGK